MIERNFDLHSICILIKENFPSHNQPYCFVSETLNIQEMCSQLEDYPVYTLKFG